ncbi:hypothetical protein AURDEDRAFT_111987 [Auricularia subglabra TFB-10046 SS5]|nr:hypothetical protein AURDEDRAFT_111987 [Auricularia subglabra TFB-10046 SS5]
MVLGFGRRSSAKKGKDDGAIKVSPSLPDLAQAQQGIPWPADLVDAGALNEVRSAPQSPPSKISFQAFRGNIPFHKPFRAGEATVEGDGSIASLYQKDKAQSPPSAFNRSSAHSMYSFQRSQRRPRVAPTFNLMVAGGQGTGKTSLLRLLLDTCEVSPNATADQRAGVERFVQSSSRATRALQTACIEICEARHDRVLLTVIDTPGLDFATGAELGLERSVSGIVKYLDLQFAETMGEESKVVRQNKGDQHVHLCIYLIEPESIMTPALRRARLALPRLSRSQTSLRYRPDDLSSVSSGESSDSSSDEDEQNEAGSPRGKTAGDKHRLSMNPAEIRVIKRLATRVNILPVIARADSLTDEKLASIKRAVRRDLLEAGVGFGVFDNLDNRESTKKSHRRPKGQSQTDPGPAAVQEDEEKDEEASRETRPKVIQIRKPRFGTLSRSRSKRNLQELDADLFGEANQPVVGGGEDAVPGAAAQHRASAALLPFAVIAPEQPRKHTRRKHKKSAAANGNGNGSAKPPAAAATDDGHQSMIASSPEPEYNERRRSTGTLDFTAPNSPVGGAPAQLPVLGVHPALRGRFVRHFRWGTVDVLDPHHCDFAALRTAVLSTHLKALKASTKDVLYEQFRTEKLLARRATRNINDEDRKRLLEDLGI